jgi:hypothetical protein
MGVLFESLLLFSLAVLIILVGLLVYYFKKRIVDVEQKNAKCFEIVQDVYMQQMQLKQEIYSVLFKQPKPTVNFVDEHNEDIVDERIRVELSEDSDDESESDDESDDESESDDDQKVKIVNVNLDYPEECDISIDNESESEDEIIDEPETGVVSLNEPETIVVNKVDSPKNAVSKEELQNNLRF